MWSAIQGVRYKFVIDCNQLTPRLKGEELRMVTTAYILKKYFWEAAKLPPSRLLQSSAVHASGRVQLKRTF
jgi:hypothetical protein